MDAFKYAENLGLGVPLIMQKNIRMGVPLIMQKNIGMGVPLIMQTITLYQPATSQQQEGSL